MVKTSVAPKYSHMDYQTYRPMTKPPKTRKTLKRSNFAEHNYNYVNPSKPTQPPRINNQNHIFSQKRNLPNTSTNSTTIHILRQIIAKTIHLFNKKRISNKHPITQTFYHLMMMINFN